MAPRKTRERLEQDRRILRHALCDFKTNAQDHLDPAEQKSVVESIKRRIQDIDARIEQFGT